ncbi:hypothetical protein Hanom_Chr16g01519961 [Helianthus anomalus]
MSREITGIVTEVDGLCIEYQQLYYNSFLRSIATGACARGEESSRGVRV